MQHRPYVIQNDFYNKLTNNNTIGPITSTSAGMGNNPMVGATVAVAVSVEEAANAGKF